MLSELVVSVESARFSESLPDKSARSNSDAASRSVVVSEPSASPEVVSDPFDVF